MAGRAACRSSWLVNGLWLGRKQEALAARTAPPALRGGARRLWTPSDALAAAHKLHRICTFVVTRLYVVGVAALPPRPPPRQDTYRQTVVVTAATSPVELGSITRTMTIITRAADRARCPPAPLPTCSGWCPSVDVRAARHRRRPDRLRAARRQFRPDARARGRRAAQRRAVGPPQRRHSGAARRRASGSRFCRARARPSSGPTPFGGTVNVITRRQAPASVRGARRRRRLRRGQRAVGRRARRRAASCSPPRPTARRGS